MNKFIIAATATLALSSLAHADPARQQGVVNQANAGYEQTLRIVPHPAQLWLSDIAPARLREHPAVIVGRNAVPADAYAARFYPHPTGGGFALPARN
ncbi:MAG: hypothetical protein ACR2FI_12730 [Burkholderiales bacterium]|nr:hypothetical protein [Burkholderiales bacterium]MDQ3196604.1 hypothetical protein [Pseudomonadota bacterium]